MTKYHLSLIIFLSLLITSCSEESEDKKFTDPHEELLLSLEEVNGNAHSYNYDYNFLKERYKLKFYKNTNISKSLESLPNEMRGKIHLPKIAELPITVNQTNANIVTSWNAKNKLVFQVQLSYLENADSYDANHKKFFIISATQYPGNPFLMPDYETKIKPETSKIYTEAELIGGLKIYYTKTYGDWVRMFDYYTFDDTSKKIFKKSTGAYQYYAWYDDLIFRIGCNESMNEEDFNKLIRKIILGK
ncbi:MAG: hypothetical protein N4A49_02860 [Marinifilaceae bacterium]|jgi:hypothetical protein|nr:hypothetical protein [Marinifilaceae bacterium]